MTGPDIHGLAGAYVLDALEPAECAAFRAHLVACSACRQEVDALRATVDRLADATSASPPAELLGAVLAQVRGTPQAPAEVPLPGAGPAEPAVAPLRRPGRRRWVALAAAAAVVVGVGVGSTVVYRDHRADQAYAALQSEVMRIVSAPDVVTHDLPLGEAHVAMSAEMSKAAVMGEDVPMPGRSGTVYQVWMMHADGSAAPGPTFMPHDGEVMAVVEGDLSAVTELTVTLEPEGGSTAPTGQPVATVLL